MLEQPEGIEQTRIYKYYTRPTQVLARIVASTPACHAGNQGSIPWRGDFLFEDVEVDVIAPSLRSWLQTYILSYYQIPHAFTCNISQKYKLASMPGYL